MHCNYYYYFHYILILLTNKNKNKRVSTQIEYQLYVSSITPNIGSIRGGTVVNVYGAGFR